MPLNNEDRLRLLNGAIQLESRSFIEYIATTAPPVDIEKYPHAGTGLADIAREEDEVVDELVETIEEMGSHADPIGSYDLNFTSYNYMTTEYALRVIAKQLEKNVARFDAILAEAKGDYIEQRLLELRAKKAHQLERIEELRRNLKKAPAPAAAAAHASDAHAHGAPHSHGGGAHGHSH